jgi:hypothetical protein
MDPIIEQDSESALKAVEKKSKIKDDIDKDIKRLEGYYRTFFGDDDALEKKVRKRGFTPEKIGINV